MSASLLIPSSEVLNFRDIDIAALEYFREYQNDNFCGDTAFSMFYAWKERFEYRYALLDNAIIVTGVGINREKGFCILSRDNGALCRAVDAVIAYCRESGIRPVFEYVKEDDTELYRECIIGNGYSAEITYDEKFSDYIYDINAFLSMTGSENKTKRGGYNYITAHYPNLRCESYSPEGFADCMAVFDKWCEVHKCENCFYGCEKKAFMRFMEICSMDRFRGAISYDGDRPLSFAVCEAINDNTMCYYFQKNAERIRGLTYWLNRQMALSHTEYDYIDLGEDMGLEGLKTDKSLLRPCKMIHKYIIAAV